MNRRNFFKTLAGMAAAMALPPLPAMGGPVVAGASYIVGESGPELFVPASDAVVGSVETVVWTHMVSSELTEEDFDKMAALMKALGL